MIHMVHQIPTLGPCYLLEMWSYEWFMLVLSRYVHNQAYPEGSMIEGYSTEEVIECCQEHIIGVDGVDDVEAYNNYDEMPLFKDFSKNISVVEKNLPKDILT